MSVHPGNPSWWRLANLLALALIFITGACSFFSTPALDSRSTPTDTGDCLGSETWTIEFGREGGIMGLTQSLELSSDGSLIAQDLQAQKSFTKTLDPTQLSEIEHQLAQACPFETQKTEQTCADCFFYDLIFRTNGARYQAQVTDLSIPPNLQPLIQTLTGLLDETIVR